MSDLAGPVSVTQGSQTITSTSESIEQIRETMQPAEVEPEPEEQEERPPVPRKVSKAAAELGKRSAEARKAKAGADADQSESVSDESESPEKDAKPLGKPRDDPRARMLEATRKEAEAKRERDAAKAEAAAARRELEALRAPKPAEKAAQPTGKPVAANFATYDEFVEALADWKADERFKERDAKAAQQSAVKQFADHIDSELGKALAARKEYEKTDPAFLSKLSDEVRDIANKPSFARDLDEKLIAEHVISDEIILSGAAGPRLMLHLSDHPEDLQRIRALLNPTEIQVEMRILAKSLNGAASTAISPRKEVSMAPQPIRPVTGGPHIDGDSDDLDDDAPLSAYVKRWNRRELNSTR